jgi:hypothetical protein
MKILHVTYNPAWFQDHFEYLCRELGHEGETQQISDMNAGPFNAPVADRLWEQHQDYYDTFDAVYVSHVANLSRIFLQNDWKKPLYIWLCFRFDYGVGDLRAFHSLIKEARNRPNVKFFAASEHDRLYIQRALGEFPVEIVPPMVYINNEGKVQIRCGHERFFVMSKHNETQFMDLQSELDRAAVPTYKHGWSIGPPDLRGVRGIIHIPYTFLTRSLYENLAIGNVFFLPTEEFMRTRINRPGFFWDVPNAIPEEVALSEWYREEHKPLFVYFSTFQELKHISDDLISEKKDNILRFIMKHNPETLEKWRGIFS